MVETAQTDEDVDTGEDEEDGDDEDIPGGIPNLQQLAQAEVELLCMYFWPNFSFFS